MNLLYPNHNFRNWGTRYRALPMAEEMVKRGHRVTLICVSPEHRWQPLWTNVHGIRIGEMPNLIRRYEGYDIIDIMMRCVLTISNRYDLIHIFDHKPNATFHHPWSRLTWARACGDVGQRTNRQAVWLWQRHSREWRTLSIVRKKGPFWVGGKQRAIPFLLPSALFHHRNESQRNNNIDYHNINENCSMAQPT